MRGDNDRATIIIVLQIITKGIAHIRVRKLQGLYGECRIGSIEIADMRLAIARTKYPALLVERASLKQDGRIICLGIYVIIIDGCIRASCFFFVGKGGGVQKEYIGQGISYLCK